MIPRAQLSAERAILVRAGVGLPPLSAFAAPVEEIEQRLVRMWSAGRSIALISACTGLEPHEIRDRCRGLPRPTIRILSAGCRRPSEASREAALLGVSSLTSGAANGAGLSFPERVGVRP